MPDDSAGDRTEEATPRQLEKKREQGQVPKSRDLAAAGILLGAVLLLKYGGGVFAWWMLSGTRRFLVEEMAGREVPDGNEIIPYALQWFLWTLGTLGPFLLAMFLLAMVVEITQVGFLWSPEALGPKFEKLNPVEGFFRMFKLQSFVQLAMNCLKLTIVGVVAYLTIIQELPGATWIPGMGVGALFKHSVDTVISLALRLSLLLLGLGLADWMYQRYQFGQDSKMTKQQVKEEYKDLEGDPHIKQKRRQKQREMAMNRMMKEVPSADVVVRNPTHFAVALKFDPKLHEVPRVVAKGTMKMAERILDEAKKAGVPCLENKPLAQLLYKRVEIGDPVPPEVYGAVAEILAHAYQLRGRTAAEMEKLMGGASRGGATARGGMRRAG